MRSESTTFYAKIECTIAQTQPEPSDVPLFAMPPQLRMKLSPASIGGATLFSGATLRYAARRPACGKLVASQSRQPTAIDRR
jgi:hypothetical protein